MVEDHQRIKAERDRLYAMTQDPANYRGAFYYNPQDKRIFPPKRNPAFGWTVNFANRKSILVFILMLLLPLMLLIGLAVLLEQ